MNMPKCSLIISVYKDTESLDLILESLESQTILPDEVIISEDGNSNKMSEYFFIAKVRFSKLNLIHLTQEDIGWRKNRALNRAIVASKYDYLIFIDGDCVPYSTFVEGHIVNSGKNIVLCGKRFELGPKFTKKIMNKQINLKNIEKAFLWYLPMLFKDHVRHPEDGLSFKSKGLIANLIHKRYVRHFIGCNVSAFKDDFMKINGFNEDFILPSEGEDVDPSWRFRSAGIELKSCRNVANIMHLWHKKRFDNTIGSINREIMVKNVLINKFYCDNGIEKL